MKKLPVYLSLALAVVGLASCEKELEEVAQPSIKTEAAAQQTPQQLLAAGQWHMTELTTTSQPADAAQPITTSIYGQLKSSMRDNLTQFTADGRYVQDEGATKINPAMPQQKSGSFQLSEDAKTLTVKLPDSERTFSVEEISASTLRLKTTSGEGAAAVTYVSTFKH
ncbi:hypothetical protein GCM10027048_01260 [Hymenobacter coalescens]